MQSDKIIRTLRVNLLDEAKAKLGQDLAQILGEIDEVTQDMKAYLAEQKGHMESLIAQRQNVALTLNRGYEFKEIECEVQRIFSENTVQVLRTDTWEVVETRAMTAEERQQELDLMSDEKAKAEIDEDLGRSVDAAYPVVDGETQGDLTELKEEEKKGVEFPEPPPAKPRRKSA